VFSGRFYEWHSQQTKWYGKRVVLWRTSECFIFLCVRYGLGGMLSACGKTILVDNVPGSRVKEYRQYGQTNAFLCSVTYESRKTRSECEWNLSSLDNNSRCGCSILKCIRELSLFCRTPLEREEKAEALPLSPLGKLTIHFDPPYIIGWNELSLSSVVVCIKRQWCNVLRPVGPKSSKWVDGKARLSVECDGMKMCCEKTMTIGWRNEWGMKWKVPDQEEYQSGHGERLW